MIDSTGNVSNYDSDSDVESEPHKFKTEAQEKKWDLKTILIGLSVFVLLASHAVFEHTSFKFRVFWFSILMGIIVIGVLIYKVKQIKYERLSEL